MLQARARCTSPSPQHSTRRIKRAREPESARRGRHPTDACVCSGVQRARKPLGAARDTFAPEPRRLSASARAPAQRLPGGAKAVVAAARRGQGPAAKRRRTDACRALRRRLSRRTGRCRRKSNGLLALRRDFDPGRGCVRPSASSATWPHLSALGEADEISALAKLPRRLVGRVWLGPRFRPGSQVHLNLL